MVTSRATGTGLGLSIVQDIISHHHGMIDVSSTQSHSPNDDFKNNHSNSQTCFTLYLPFTQPLMEA
jgi:two-component system nitrogen regulation sensor histidine kinase GlnL